jgi:starch synthase
VFQEPSAAALLAAIGRAGAAWRDGATWRALQRNGMSKDFSWSASARRYAAIYAQLAGTPRRDQRGGR